MDKLLIIADDFTGALDTGIQFTNMGIGAKIITDYQYDFSQFKEEYSLLVVNADTRPLSPEDAYQRVYELSIHAKSAGFRYVYKKTDSALRGNVGAELKAVMDAYEQDKAYCIPALPVLNRITKDGIQYIDGVPVKDSVFGKDPFEPVLHSDVAEIIQTQYEIHVEKVPVDAYETVNWNPKEKTVFLFDAEMEEDVQQIAQQLKKKTDYTICVGCAGFAAGYETLLDFQKGNPHFMQETDGLLALCGSVNAITVNQLEYADKHGFARSHLHNEQKLIPGFMNSKEGKKFLEALYRDICKTDKYIVDTLDELGFETVNQYCERMNRSSTDVRFQIADTLGMIAAGMIQKGLNYTISMTGGDTLMGFMRVTNTTELVPICEIGKGAVLSAMRWNGKRIQVISKSGGFGDVDVFEKMYQMIIKKKWATKG